MEAWVVEEQKVHLFRMLAFLPVESMETPKEEVLVELMENRY